MHGSARQSADNPAWLICQNIYSNGLVISKSAGFEGVGLKVSIDPAARDCVPSGGGEQDPVKVVLTCRGQLVVESLKPVSGPY
jgi:hypothetical protein